MKEVSLGIGRKTYSWTVYIAAITDGLILGLDFIPHYKAIVNLQNSTLTLNGEVLLIGVEELMGRSLKLAGCF